MLKSEMEKLYESGDWIAIGKDNGYNWQIIENSIFSGFDSYKLIHKKHKYILDAYFNKEDIYVVDPFSEKIVKLKDNFIYFYCPSDIYYVVPKTLNNCYCIASEIHRKMLKDNRLPVDENITLFYYNNSDKKNKEHFVWTTYEPKNHLKIEYNTDLEKWVYCSNINKGDNMQQEKDELFENNNFNEYGFKTPNFNGEILKEVDEFYIGYIKFYNGSIISKKWFKNGKSADQNRDDLIPIKKWYEKEENLHKIVYIKKLDLYGIFNEIYKKDNMNYILINNTYYHINDVRLVNCEELESINEGVLLAHLEDTEENF